jgi:myo-inositol 2-dehydrogenase/D-chiro-inositol 1-dehydrogenase
MSSPTLKVGIVGLGRLGQRHAINLAQRVPNAKSWPPAVPCRRNWTGPPATLGITTGYADYDALLAHPGLDAVFLVTPTSLHADQIIAALRAGKHVFCEKPCRWTWPTA